MTWRPPLFSMLAALALCASAVMAQDLAITILSPTAGVPVFGEVDFRVELYPSGGQASVELRVDGRTVATLDEPPFAATVDVGQDNVEHRFEAVARGPDGASAEALLVSPDIEVDLSVEAELQQLYVTATRDGRRVLDLGQRDFSLIDNGSPQEIITFARGDVRLTAVLLVDASASMRGDRLRYALRGARAFVAGMKPTDDASIVLFSDRLLHKTPFSNDAESLATGLANVRAAGGTALNDHLYYAFKRLERQQGRRVVILLSDGFDSHSALRMREARWLSRRSRALLYWIRIGGPDASRASRFSALKDPDSYRAEYQMLSDTVTETGGRIVSLDGLEQSDAAFREILAELREQYVLGYYPSNARNDGSWHQVFVRPQRSGIRLRTRGGYLDY